MKVILALEDALVCLQMCTGMVRNERLLLVYGEQAKSLELMLSKGYELYDEQHKSFNELRKSRWLRLVLLDFKGSMAADKNQVLLKANEEHFKRLESQAMYALGQVESEKQRAWLQQVSQAAAEMRDQLHVVRLTRF